MQTGGAYLLWNNATGAGRMALNGEVTGQALSIAYVDDFKLMFWVGMPAALLLMRKPAHMVKPEPAHAVMD